MLSEKQEDHPIILLKYGGNAMTDESLREKLIQNICRLHDTNYRVVIVHGGGPFIEKILDLAGVESEFVAGQRKTTPEALHYIEMALKGEVNGMLVNLINRNEQKAVGLSGKDGKMVICKKRFHKKQFNGGEGLLDMGNVGDVEQIDTRLINDLLKGGYIPVITCLASDKEGNDYNINADMFAGHLAGALKASQYIVLTDVDGLMENKNDPSTLMKEVSLEKLPDLYGNVIQGGMIPKLESCQIALQTGAKTARILNGTKPEAILSNLIEKKPTGTLISQ